MRVPRPLLLVVALLAVAACLALVLTGFGGSGPQERNLLAERGQYADPGAKAAAAADQARADGDVARADLFDELASVPSGIWLTPEQHPVETVGDHVTTLVTSADERGEVALLVVYGVPERDCAGLLSAGGLPPEDYPTWVGRIATALAQAPGRAVVVLEPDALATAQECGRRAERVEQIEGAVGLLAQAGVTTYVDAGHSDWVGARAMAQLLEDVGVERVRGFATNVSNFQLDDDERAYAEMLDELVPGEQHWLIDRGRNGSGAGEDWCNPEGATLGQRPGFVDDGTGLDAFVWVKPPGESDGTCAGGPPAGEFWPDGAWRLAGE